MFLPDLGIVPLHACCWQLAVAQQAIGWSGVWLTVASWRHIVWDRSCRSMFGWCLRSCSSRPSWPSCSPP